MTSVGSSLDHPVDPGLVLRKRRALRAQLWASGDARQRLKIAVLGGSTTAEVVGLLDLFLLKAGFSPEFYESDYNRFSEEALYGAPALDLFQPDLIYLHVTWRNLTHWPQLLASAETAAAAVASELQRFHAIWAGLERKFGKVIIQNNFDPPNRRILGNRDAVEPFGRTHFVAAVNAALAEEAAQNPKLVINDIAYLAAEVGLSSWADQTQWFAYKLAMTPVASVRLSQNLAGIIASLYGKSKKCLVLDLDNTLWGGVIGDDGLDRIILGEDTAAGEAFLDFQRYVKQLKERGVLLAVCSKNELKNAREGFSHPDSILSLDDFAAFKANWEPKHLNLLAIASELNIGVDSLVFIDDNPAERELVRSQLASVAVPEVGSDVVDFAGIIESAGYFESIHVSSDDLERHRFYKENQLRSANQEVFASYDEYLRSLKMSAEIGPFSERYFERVTQLINKTNQFNLTTRRLTMSEVIEASNSAVTLFGRLVDKFGDNGLVTVVIGEIAGEFLDITLWLMSCRVLKRGMEHAMFDSLVAAAQQRGLSQIRGTYIRSAKNEMVKDHYESLGFVCIESIDNGARSTWEYKVSASHLPLNQVIGRSS